MSGIFDYFKMILAELAMNGKSLVAWIMNEVPGVTGYPGLVAALNDVAANPNTGNLINLAFQALFAGSSGHRLVKILINSAQTYSEKKSF